LSDPVAKAPAVTPIATPEESGGRRVDAGFATAADKAVGRLVSVRFCQLLRSSVVGFLLLGLLPLLVARFLGVDWACGWVALGACLLWGGVCWGIAWIGRPDRFGGLARWDRAAGRQGTFSSALAFEGMVDPGLGESIHLQRAGAELDKALPNLASDLPLGMRHWTWVVPVLGVLLFLVPWTRPALEAGEETLTQDMLADAAAEADLLQRSADDLSAVGGLSAEEKAKMEQLKKSVAATAEEVGDASGKTTREVLDALEERAREAEKLARELGLGGEPWASEAMVEALREGPDTADFGDAIGDEDTGSAASEATRLAEQLEAEDLSDEVASRMEQALNHAVDAGDEADSSRLAGKAVTQGAKELEQGSEQGAAESFRQLARSLKQVEEREKTQEELEKLAQQLRQAGSNISGTGADGMEQLAGNDGQSSEGQDQSNGMSQLGSNDALSESMPMPGQQGRNQQPQPQSQQGGMGQSQQMQMGQMQAPQPGQQQPQQGQGQKGGRSMALQQAPNPGQGKDQGQGQPMMMAPIPGLDPSEQPSALMFGGDPSDGQPAGTIMMSGGPSDKTGQGGLQAGFGTTELGANETDALDASRSSMVGAQAGRDGASYTRAVEGGVREEATSRSARGEAAEFLRVQEEALDGQALPMSRREHVLRYFKAVRQQFEGEE